MRQKIGTSEDMTETSDEEVVVVEGRPPSGEERFLLDWGRETLKGSYESARDAVRQLLNLIVALLGGGVLLGEHSKIHPALQGAAMVCLLLALMMAIQGILPFDREVDLSRPDDIAQFKQESLRIKARSIKGIAIFLAAAFIFATIGIVFGRPSTTPSVLEDHSHH